MLPSGLQREKESIFLNGIIIVFASMRWGLKERQEEWKGLLYHRTSINESAKLPFHFKIGNSNVLNCLSIANAN